MCSVGTAALATFFVILTVLIIVVTMASIRRLKYNIDSFFFVKWLSVDVA